MELIPNICVLAAAGIFVFSCLKAYRNRNTVSGMITVLLAGICISSCFLFFPGYLEQSRTFFADPGANRGDFSVLRTVALTVYDSLKAISGGQEIGDLEKLTVSGMDPAIRLLYFSMNYLFLVAAPLLTSSLVISLIGDLGDQLRCLVFRDRTYHVFSELNSNAVCLAEKIRDKHPLDRILFCNTKKADKELQIKAKKMGALLLYAPCTSEKLRLGKKQLRFYLISASEDINLRHAEDLICKHRERQEEGCIINALAQSGAGIQMVENMDKGNVGVRFVDTTALFCCNLLLEHPLYRLPEGTDTVSVVIVGCDTLGMRLLKTITWCGVMDGYGLKIRVYDKNAGLLQKKLEAQCPELMDNCDVAFITVDAQSSDLEARILDPQTGSADATYIVMAMGDDDLNIAVAERLSRLFRHHNRYTWMPRILARIRNCAKADVFREQENAYLKQMQIYPFGGIDGVFADGVLHQSQLENMAFAVDLCYRGLLPEQDPMTMTAQELRAYFNREKVRSARSKFLQSEYNRRSSMAAALHIPVKLYNCGILPADQKLPSAEHARRFRKLLAKDPALPDRLAATEHLRWNRFLRSEGYVQASWDDLLCFYPALEKKDNQDKLSKRHLCLVPWEQLDALNQKYLQLDPPEKKNFKKSDLDIIRGIPKILLLAKRMEEISPEDQA